MSRHPKLKKKKKPQSRAAQLSQTKRLGLGAEQSHLTFPVTRPGLPAGGVAQTANLAYRASYRSEALACNIAAERFGENLHRRRHTAGLTSRSPSRLERDEKQKKKNLQLSDIPWSAHAEHYTPPCARCIWGQFIKIYGTSQVLLELKIERKIMARSASRLRRSTTDANDT